MVDICILMYVKSTKIGKIKQKRHMYATCDKNGQKKCRIFFGGTKNVLNMAHAEKDNRNKRKTKNPKGF